jgi:SAM-dependent methyltransferase
MTISFDKVSDDYAQYRDHLPDVFFQQLMSLGIDFQGLEVVDLGSGTGILSRDLAQRGANVIGIEPSGALIEQAEEMDHAARLSIQYVQESAENFQLNRTIPIFAALRAWHWFDRDQVLRNIRSHMGENGRLIITHAVFTPDSEVAQLTFRVLSDNQVELKPAGSLADTKERRTGFPANWFEEWDRHGFHVAAEWQHDYSLSYTHEAWCGKIRSVSWLAGMEQARRSRISEELMEELRSLKPELIVPHRYSVAVLHG